MKTGKNIETGRFKTVEDIQTHINKHFKGVVVKHEYREGGGLIGCLNFYKKDKIIYTLIYEDHGLTVDRLMLKSDDERAVIERDTMETVMQNLRKAL